MKFFNLSILLITTVSLPLTSAFSQEDPVNLKPEAIDNLKLDYAKVTRQPIQHSLRAAGTVRLNEKRVVEVTPKIPGVIVSDPRSLGDRVNVGDVLAKLQSQTLSEMIANYVAAEEAMTFAIVAVEQERKLEAQKLSSAEQLREKEQAMKQAVAAHARSLQPLKLLDFNEGTIHAYLANVEGSDYTSLELKAPEGGEIIAKEVRRGAAVEQDQSLFTIADLTELWVDFYVSLREVGTLAVGGKVEIESTVSRSHRNAEVIYISPVADEQSRAVLVRAVLINKDGAWRPGTPVTVMSLTNGSIGEQKTSVPTSALIDFHGGKAVFVKQGETAFIPTPVKTGASDGSMTEIVDGLSDGQVVVSRNAAQLKGHLEMTVGE